MKLSKVHQPRESNRFRILALVVFGGACEGEEGDTTMVGVQTSMINMMYLRHSCNKNKGTNNSPESYLWVQTSLNRTNSARLYNTHRLAPS